MMNLTGAMRRAALCMLDWRFVLWSLPPLAAAGVLALGLGWLYWEPSVAGLRELLDRWSVLAVLFDWLESSGAAGLRAWLAPLIVVSLAVPAVVTATLLLTAWLMTPALVIWIARRERPALQPLSSGWARAVVWSVPCTIAALVALVLSIPLWFIPPLIVVLPPMVWGWLAYRILAFVVLAWHADAGERRWLLHSRRWPLRAAGLVTGYLAFAPSLLWAPGMFALEAGPLRALLALWLYIAVFGFASMWFAHYLLAALDGLRGLAVKADGALE